MKEKYCLESVAAFQTINQSPNNKSATKATFSFSKSPRFQNIKSVCPTATYAGEPIKRKNSGTSIGYGKKSDFTKCLAVSPESSKYEIKNFFDINQEKKKGFTLSVSREKLVFDSYINPEIGKYPGIAKYRIETQSRLKQRQAPSYSMRKKTKILDLTKTIQPQNKNPSPSDYQNNPESGFGSRYASKFQRLSFSTSKSNRFDDSNNRIPGPGQYNEVSTLSNAGKYVISTHRGGTNAKFDTSRRVTKFDESAKIGLTKPGPGYYKSTSQFGQYDGAVYPNQLKKSTSKMMPKK